MTDSPYSPPDSPCRVPFEDRFCVNQSDPRPPADAPDKDTRKRLLAECVTELDALQRTLYADNRHAVLLIFQAMDAAGKDGTLRAVLSGVNPAGCQVYSFKRPSDGELDHDFLWRHLRCLPERGRIGVFNRSWSEEVLAVRVIPAGIESLGLSSGAVGGFGPIRSLRGRLWPQDAAAVGGIHQIAEVGCPRKSTASGNFARDS